MKELKCQNCGGNEWIESGGIRKCAFCGSTYQLTREDIQTKESSIELNSDVERILAKCEKDPKNAKKYANLILDIDPGNKKAKKILRGY